jgi:hypothetical protein
MSTLKPMTVFDICPDIEGLIEDELNVLLKFREATREFKLRIGLNKRIFDRIDREEQRDKYDNELNPHNCVIRVLFPYIRKTNWFNNGYSMPKELRKAESLNIHGFVFESRERYRMNVDDPDIKTKDAIEDTSDNANLNTTLTMLGAKRFKSKKKAEKIKLLLTF